jgi:alpha-tubulin suppressor-like RCC1 family protein
VTEDGDVYTWGLGKNGALGHGDWAQVNMPKKVEGLKDIVKIDCGMDYTMCMDKNGKLYSWGSNRYGQLGITGTNTYKINKPMSTSIPPGVATVIEFSCGEEHSAFLTEKGEVFTWGYGNDGQLGHQDKVNLNQPRKLQFDQKISKVVCGGGHTGIITSDKGLLFLFGRGRDGQLGRGDVVESMAAYRTEPK